MSEPVAPRRERAAVLDCGHYALTGQDGCKADEAKMLSRAPLSLSVRQQEP